MHKGIQLHENDYSESERYSSGSEGITTNFTTSKRPSKTNSAGGKDDDIPEGNFIGNNVISNNSNDIIGADMVGVSMILLGVVLGIGLGILLSFFDVDKTMSDWINLPGKLFLNALKCLVSPMVFASLSVCIADLLNAGKASIIGLRLTVFFLFTSIVACTQSVLWGALFRSQFTIRLDQNSVSKNVTFAMQCNDKNYMMVNGNGTISCTSPVLNSTAYDTTFTLKDPNNIFKIKTGDKFIRMTLTESIFGVLKMLVPMNIFEAFVKAELLSIVMFATIFGIAIVKTSDFNMDGSPHSPIYQFMSMANSVFQLLIQWVIGFAPLAIMSLVGGAFAKYNNQIALLKSVGYLILALACSLSSHLFGVMCPIFFMVTRRNPFTYLKKILPAQVFIFGCSSSMATLPITIRCVDSTKEVSRSLTRFVCSIAATVNMDGTAMYMPLAVIFVAETSGMGDELDTFKMGLLAFVAALASIGVAPIPHSGLVMVITVWKTVMSNELPPAFSFLVATDWILNRMRAVLNITDDALLVRILADQIDETYEDEQARDLEDLEE